MSKLVSIRVESNVSVTEFPEVSYYADEKPLEYFARVVKTFQTWLDTAVTINVGLVNNQETVGDQSGEWAELPKTTVDYTRQKVEIEGRIPFLSRLLHDSAMENMGIKSGSTLESVFLGLALAGEAGELANKIKKEWRDGESQELRTDILKELADNLLYIDHLLDCYGVTADQVKAMKLDELYNERDIEWSDGARKKALEEQNGRA